MTGQTPSNEWGVEGSGFVTSEFSDYREKKNSAMGGSGKGTDVNYKEVIYAEGRNGRKMTHNSLFFNAHSFTAVYINVTHAHTGLASFRNTGCSMR